MKKKLWGKIGFGSLILLLVLFLGFVFFSEKINLSPDFGSKLSVIESEKLTEAKSAIIESGGHDYSKVYELVEEEKGDQEKIFAVCDEVEPVFCLKKASQENPELRENICDRLKQELNEKYVARGVNINVEGHFQECMMGIPQFAI